MIQRIAKKKKKEGHRRKRFLIWLIAKLLPKYHLAKTRGKKEGA